jgi:hypothetical protein
MIKSISATGRFLQVQGGQASSTYINSFSGAQGIGNMRYNTSTQQMEVFDGNNWQMLATTHATVDLTYEAQELLEWARTQKLKEAERKNRIANNPALQKAYEAIRRAEENFDLLEAIAGDFKLEEKESL